MTNTANLTQLVNRIICAPVAVSALTVDELFALDVELTNRAVMLGKRGQVSRPHAAVRRELNAR